MVTPAPACVQSLPSWLYVFLIKIHHLYCLVEVSSRVATDIRNFLSRALHVRPIHWQFFTINIYLNPFFFSFFMILLEPSWWFYAYLFIIHFISFYSLSWSWIIYTNLRFKGALSLFFLVLNRFSYFYLVLLLLQPYIGSVIEIISTLWRRTLFICNSGFRGSSLGILGFFWPLWFIESVLIWPEVVKSLLLELIRRVSLGLDLLVYDLELRKLKGRIFLYLLFYILKFSCIFDITIGNIGIFKYLLNNSILIHRFLLIHWILHCRWYPRTRISQPTLYLCIAIHLRIVWVQYLLRNINRVAKVSLAFPRTELITFGLIELRLVVKHSPIHLHFFLLYAQVYRINLTTLWTYDTSPHVWWEVKGALRRSKLYWTRIRALVIRSRIYVIVACISVWIHLWYFMK